MSAMLDEHTLAVVACTEGRERGCRANCTFPHRGVPDICSIRKYCSVFECSIQTRIIRVWNECGNDADLNDAHLEAAARRLM